MQIFATLLVAFNVLASTTSGLPQVQDAKVEFLAKLTNQLNGDIVHTTQFFGAFPDLHGSALTIQASAAKTALRSAIEVVDTIAQELANYEIAQEVKVELVDNDFLLNISLQLQDFAEDLPSEPFLTTLGLYCSTVIPKINALFQIAGNVINSGITIFAIPPNNCPDGCRRRI